MRLQRIRDNTLGRPPGAPAPKPADEPLNGTSKKRKADGEEEPVTTKKKAKAQEGVPEGVFQENAQEVESEGDLPRQDGEGLGEPMGAASISQPSTPPTEPTFMLQKPSLNNIIPSSFLDNPHPPQNAQTQVIDENEWAAFERDVATPPPPPSILTSTATITAAPLTAAEIAAQARKQASLQTKERMEAVIEGEKEDAARRLEEEFDEMAELEERVRRLREKREMLRKERREQMRSIGDDEDSDDDDADGDREGGSEGGDDADDDNAGSDDDDWDEWGR